MNYDSCTRHTLQNKGRTASESPAWLRNSTATGSNGARVTRPRGKPIGAELSPPSRTAAEFDKQCNDSEGLCNVIKFAREHNKKVGVGEWGVAKSASQGGGGAGDNPIYIQKMYETFYAARDVMAYESYFNEAAYGNALVNPRQNQNSADRYVALFGANSSSIVTPPPTPPLTTPLTPPTTPPGPNPQPNPADLNRDGKVNISDLSKLLSAWGTGGADLNGDGTTNISDLSRLLSAWNP